MVWVCPLCGYDNDDDAVTCICGHKREDSSGLNDESEEALSKERRSGSTHILDRPSQRPPESPKKVEVKVTEKPASGSPKNAQKTEKTSDEILIKEVNGWQFTYSHNEGRLFLGTPALQSFRLMLTIDDIQEILDYMYEKSGMEKTTRKLTLSNEDILELVSVLDGMIEEKRSKVKITYSDKEIDAIADLINKKIKA